MTQEQAATPAPPTPHLDEYRRLSAGNPALAARYANAHAGALTAERGALRAHEAPPVAPPPPAPAPAPPPAPEHLERFEQLRASNPVLAARYHNEYAPAILAARRARRAS